jgi:hypothetical protein
MVFAHGFTLWHIVLVILYLLWETVLPSLHFSLERSTFVQLFGGDMHVDLGSLQSSLKCPPLLRVLGTGFLKCTWTNILCTFF